MFNSSQSNTSGQWETQLETQERQAYLEIFSKVDIDNKGIALKDESMAFFKKTAIPDNILEEIWEAADEENKGFLTTKEFCIALKLIACAQHGKLTSTPILSTSVPMPYFDGVSTKPVTPARSNTVVHPRIPSSPKTTSADTITPEERNNYIRVFQSSDPINGVLTSDKATSIFLRSNLPSSTLQHIWDLADTRKSGSLNQTEFIIAMHYITVTRNGTLTTLPPTLPDSIYAAATGRLTNSLGRHNTTIVRSPNMQPMRSPILQQQQHTGNSHLRSGTSSFYSNTQQQHSILNVSNEEYKKYKVLFQQLASNDKGTISGADAVHFFRHSKLPETDLAQIWDLADTRSIGELSQNEFIVAMHLVNRRMAGEPIPSMLPASTFQLSSPMLSNNNQLAPPPTPQRPNPPPSSTFDLLGLGDSNNDVQPTATVSTASNSSNLATDQFDNIFNIGNQPTNNNNNDGTNKKSLLENNLTSLQSQVKTETALINTLQSQKQGVDNSVKVLEESIEKEKQHLESLKRTVEELEQHIKNQQMKKETLTRDLQTYKQESKHFQQRVDHHRQESKELENEINDLEKKRASSSSSFSGNINTNVSATSSPFLSKSAITSPSIPTASPSMNDPNSLFALSTPISDHDLFAKVQDVASPTLSTTSSHNTTTTATKTNINNNNAATIDPFAIVQQKKALANTSPSLNKLKHESDIRRVSTPNVDISEVEAKFPDLSTMEHDFNTNHPPPSSSSDTVTSPKNVPSSPPPSSSSIIKSPTLQQQQVKSTGAGSSLFGITDNNKNKSKYGFDLSLFESGSNTISSPNTSSSLKDDLTSIFSNTNSPDISASPLTNNNNNNNNQKQNNNDFDQLFGISSNTNQSSSQQQEKPISFADAFL
ncbi:hypothetical protein BJ944DRAFT_172591 [Cunninghamella echinulata]|nr:hypothetical protein BJ944DRAFT_172591 [Cunninghamella echinulata]